MPPRSKFSRHALVVGIQDDNNRVFLSDREPFTYKELPDTEHYIVKQTDTMMRIAGRKYRGMLRPAGLWWVIADFQIGAPGWEEPPSDPTLELALGAILFLPSQRVVQEDIISERRRDEMSPTSIFR